MVWKPQSIFIYGLTGGGGNLVSVLIRHVIGSNPRIHSGGGSVVIMGLVGLCAVVGLRSRTEMGVSMGRLMVFFMVVTAVLGAALPQFIDNWGHAGGAIGGNRGGVCPSRIVARRPQAVGMGQRRGDGDHDRGLRGWPRPSPTDGRRRFVKSRALIRRVVGAREELSSSGPDGASGSPAMPTPRPS